MSANARPKLLCVVGARPNFMKIAPLMAAFRSGPQPLTATLVHTGQHYDAAMKTAFFDQLGIPEPDIDLGVGSGSHSQQTAEIMRRFEPVLEAEAPDAVLVVGDVNSTIACALVAAKQGVPVIHVEAGLRSYDRGMPEEINRVLTDQLSELLFLTEAGARDNLRREGIADERIHFVGNVMIDTLLGHLSRAVPAEQTLERAGGMGFLQDGRGFGVLTLHRPSNVDEPVVLRRLLGVIRELSTRTPIVFPMHPRTRARARDMGLMELLETPDILTLEPLGYLELLGLMSRARLVLTDSGGLQEETTALGVPCITLRENTERPITVSQGTNTIVGTDVARIRAVVEETLATGGKRGRVPELWDGKAAQRIKQIILDWHDRREAARAVS
ncbi:UDP-N-acetylglucosamine 2-epimerase (non-hydrolyzing) [Thiohalobacter sp. COW1]|uniref:UDP-N-acetylglucosamine 2-epimerase n=1 Tax=Thiohalobacter thiocyanaticus TaxID=585455 RepID=A0A1Z4VTH5_9GAMM|nr:MULTISPECIES: UDP-N-acetylglucosamine 2-epimerase (non-hydrolyzing) [Thiohalobacter]BAZ94702.1 UDP-N-acetylglucosamine 2-epimerase [Thiohalobacter thiocyanaticus]BCO30230.1 UDP-N-acetylglucosamine 2-epimerase (non-hydrolyzing) [Thiohalobacter sp. COW1]